MPINSAFCITVPATSANLGSGLDVLGLSLDFRNEFCLHPAKETSIEIYGEGAGVKRFIADNMFVRVFYKTIKILSGGDENPKYRFVFQNKIPISRGMGSSSAIIIGAISAAYRALDLPLDRDCIVQKALYYEHHPDNITPATFGGLNVAMLGEGKERGKVLHIKHKMPNYLRAIMVIPERSTSTKMSRQSLPKKYSFNDAVYNLSHASLLVASIMQEKWDFLRYASRDRFHQERRMRSTPVLFAVQKCALANGAILSTLSGSGSSFLNLCFEEDSKRLFSELSERFKKLRVLELKLDNDGILLEN
ncbi:homoserine kinase [Helicobacter sp. T3_23-1059]